MPAGLEQFPHHLGNRSIFVKIDFLDRCQGGEVLQDFDLDWTSIKWKSQTSQTRRWGLCQVHRLGHEADIYDLVVYRGHNALALEKDVHFTVFCRKTTWLYRGDSVVIAAVALSPQSGVYVRFWDLKAPMNDPKTSVRELRVNDLHHLKPLSPTKQERNRVERLLQIELSDSLRRPEIFPDEKLGAHRKSIPPGDYMEEEEKNEQKRRKERQEKRGQKASKKKKRSTASTGSDPKKLKPLVDEKVSHLEEELRQSQALVLDLQRLLEESQSVRAGLAAQVETLQARVQQLETTRLHSDEQVVLQLKNCLREEWESRKERFSASMEIAMEKPVTEDLVKKIRAATWTEAKLVKKLQNIHKNSFL